MNETLSAITLPFAFVVIALVIALVCLQSIRRMLLPTSHLLAGRYPQARVAAEKLARSWMCMLPDLRAAAHYTAASAEHLEGNLEASLEILRRLDVASLNKNLRYAALSLEAANLVLQDRHHERALAAINEARSLQDSPEDLLFATHALASLGRPMEAEALFIRAGEVAGGDRARFGHALAYDTGPIKNAMFHYLRGAYLARTVRADRGRSDFETAATSKTKSVYSARARKALEGRAPIPSQVEEPSSLSPLVLSSLLADLPPSRRGPLDS